MIFNILSALTTFLEGVLSASLIFGIPSKILGALLGFVESCVLIFALLFILTLPVFQFNDYIMSNSKYAKPILLHTPVLSNYTQDAVEIVNEFASLKDKYKTAENPMEFNKQTLNLFLKYKIVTVESVETLVSKDKIRIDAIEELLRCYREKTKDQCK